MGLHETGTLRLGQKVEVSVCLAAAPYVTGSLHGEGQCGHLVQMPPGVVRADVGHTVSLHQDAQDVGTDAGGLAHFEVDVGTDVGLGVLQL